MKAMILAAGFGTRLRVWNNAVPKPLVPLKGKAMVERVAEYLARFGVDEFMINTHHMAEQMENHFNGSPFPYLARFIYEPEILGTGGGIFNIRDFWDEGDFFVQNADILCDADLSKMIEAQRKNSWTATLAVQNRDGDSLLLADNEGRLCGRQRHGKRKFFTKPRGEVISVGFCGIHLISPKIFNRPHPEIEFSIIDIYTRLIGEGVEIGCWNIGQAYWTDIGTPESLEKAEKEYPRND